MRRTVLSVLICLLLCATAPALACHFEYVTPTADCEGWSIDGMIWFSGGDTVADVTWSIVLSDQDGMVAEASGTATVHDTDPYFLFADLWGMELCGEYTVSGEVSLVSAQSTDRETFEVPAFLCECDEPEPELCAWTPGYWKNHEEMWPVDHLMVGCTDYGQAQLLDIFDWPTRGDATVKLFHHLVAAKLNVLVSEDDSMDEVLSDADDFLCDHPLGSAPEGDLKTMANHLKDLLVDYNEGWPCDDDEDDYDCDATLMKFSETPAVPTSWGAMKAGYR